MFSTGTSGETIVQYTRNENKFIFVDISLTLIFFVVDF